MLLGRVRRTWGRTASIWSCRASQGVGVGGVLPQVQRVLLPPVSSQCSPLARTGNRSWQWPRSRRSGQAARSSTARHKPRASLPSKLCTALPQTPTAHTWCLVAATWQSLGPRAVHSHRASRMGVSRLGFAHTWCLVAATWQSLAPEPSIAAWRHGWGYPDWGLLNPCVKKKWLMVTHVTWG